MFAKPKDLKFAKMTEKDLEEYNIVKQKSFFWRLKIFCALIPIIFIFSAILYYESGYIPVFFLIVTYIICIWGEFVLCFLFPPVGIKYGHLSQIHYRNYGKYSEPKCNIFFPEERKSLKNVRVCKIGKIKNDIIIQRKTNIKVIKTKFGKLYIYAYK